jgi:hypothetical protein
MFFHCILSNKLDLIQATFRLIMVLKRIVHQERLRTIAYIAARRLKKETENNEACNQTQSQVYVNRVLGF